MQSHSSGTIDTSLKYRNRWAMKGESKKNVLRSSTLGAHFNQQKKAQIEVRVGQGVPPGTP